jgi:hypothetical protein
METKEIRALLTLAEGDEIPRGWGCPDENRLAAYTTGQLPPGNRKAIEAHAADCKPCIQTIALLARTLEDREVPGQLLVRARALANEKQARKWRWQWATAAATACVLIVLSVVVWRLSAQRTPTAPGDMIAQQQPTLARPPVDNATPANHTARPALTPKPIEPPKRIVRGDNDQSGPALITPREGAIIESAQQTLRWQSVPGTTFYEIRVVTPDGAPVLNERSNTTQLNLSQSLPPGKYFVTVVAHLSEGRTVKSLSSFRVALGVRRPGAAL